MEKNNLTPAEKMIIIGGSAGSLDVILNLLPELSPALSSALILVLHRKSNSDSSSLPALLSRKTALPVIEVEEKDPVQPGYIYVAPADYHLLIEKDHSFSLDYSEKVHFSRPSLDVSFESAADAYGNALLGILLSGANHDGAAGMVCIQKNGGETIIQDPQTADVNFMPQYALTKMKPGHILHAHEIGRFINYWDSL